MERQRRDRVGVSREGNFGACEKVGEKVSIRLERLSGRACVPDAILVTGACHGRRSTEIRPTRQTKLSLSSILKPRDLHPQHLTAFTQSFTQSSGTTMTASSWLVPAHFPRLRLGWSTPLRARPHLRRAQSTLPKPPFGLNKLDTTEDMRRASAWMTVFEKVHADELPRGELSPDLPPAAHPSFPLRGRHRRNHTVRLQPLTVCNFEIS